MKSTTVFSPSECRTRGGRTLKSLSPSTAIGRRPVASRMGDYGRCQCRRLCNIPPSRLRPLQPMVRPFLEVPSFIRTDMVNSDRIPVPQIGQGSPFTNLATSGERKAVRRSLEEISRNSMKLQNGPKSLQDVGHSVDMLLDGEALPELYVVHLSQDLIAQRSDTHSPLTAANSKRLTTAIGLSLPRVILLPHSPQSSARSQQWCWSHLMLHTNVR